MKPTLLALAFSISSVAALFGINASPFAVELKQPDGTIIQLKVCGDEFANWFEDEKGFTVVRSGATYVYARLAGDGRLTPTAHRVGAVDPATTGLPQRVKPLAAAVQNARLRMVAPSVRAPGATGVAAAEQGPVAVSPVGTAKNLVVLCQFSDHDGTKIRSQADFDTLFNATGGHATIAPTGSVKDYFTEVSYGTLTLQSTVVAWVTLPHTEAYYANGSTGFDGAYPNNAQGMVKDALDLVDPLIDFGQFDADNNGYIDAIDIVHSGYGAEWGGGGGNWIWSHKWSLWQVPGGLYTTQDNNALATKVKVYDYHTEPALWGTSGTEIGRIGVICHETGHFFGLPDLYDTDQTSEGIGSYCLMANSWGFDGTQLHPPHFSAWCKAQLGWVTPTVVSGGTISAPRVATNKSIFRINTGYPSNEYLLVENRQAFGFENVMPQGGLAIWHIDLAKSNNNSEGYPGQSGWPSNNNHYRIALLQADGLYEQEKGLNRGNAGDVYRGGGVSSITPATTPNTDRYQGGTVAPSNNSITSISTAGSTMSFTLSNSVYPAITSALTANGLTGIPFTYQIVASNTPTSYSASGLPVGLSINSATGLISGTPGSPGTSEVLLTATNASGSASQSLTLTIALGSSLTFTGTGNIAIPASGNATPYPSTIAVSGLANLISAVRVRLYGVTHTAPDDLDVFLVGPSGSVCAVMSDAGGSTGVSAIDLVFDDAAVTTIPDATAISAGSYRPANHEAVEPLPPGGIGAIGTSLSALGSSVNGTWKLFVADDSGGFSGSIGSWALEFELGGIDSRPLITSSDSVAGVRDQPFAHQITTNNPATSFSVSGSLPAGLSLNTTSGLISGTPTAVGTTQIQVSASNANGSVTQLLTITIAAPAAYSFALNTDPGWTRQGEWAFGTPTGSGGAGPGNPDPSAGATGTNVFGVNLGGDYSIVVGGPYYLTTGPLDFSGTTSTKLRFKR